MITGQNRVRCGARPCPDGHRAARAECAIDDVRLCRRRRIGCRHRLNLDRGAEAERDLHVAHDWVAVFVGVAVGVLVRVLVATCGTFELGRR
jgi:hypothetical protein